MTSRPEKQIGALPWRIRKDEIEVLLITSRETGRWVIPKGWPMKGKSDSSAAKTEAFEEAGVKGRIRRVAIGRYDYIKRHADGDFPCRVAVYALEVENLAKTWPEKRQRRREWFDCATAAALVDEAGLHALISTFPARRTAKRK